MISIKDVMVFEAWNAIKMKRGQIICPVSVFPIGNPEVHLVPKDGECRLREITGNFPDIRANFSGRDGSAGELRTRGRRLSLANRSWKGNLRAGRKGLGPYQSGPQTPNLIHAGRMPLTVPTASSPNAIGHEQGQMEDVRILWVANSPNQRLGEVSS